LAEQFQEFLNDRREQLSAPVQNYRPARPIVRPKKSCSRFWVLPKEMSR
jgi:hypothetical protein